MLLAVVAAAMVCDSAESRAHRDKRRRIAGRGRGDEDVYGVVSLTVGTGMLVVDSICGVFLMESSVEVDAWAKAALAAAAALA